MTVHEIAQLNSSPSDRAVKIPCSHINIKMGEWPDVIRVTDTGVNYYLTRTARLADREAAEYQSIGTNDTPHRIAVVPD